MFGKELKSSETNENEHRIRLCAFISIWIVLSSPLVQLRFNFNTHFDFVIHTISIRSDFSRWLVLIAFFFRSVCRKPKSEKLKWKRSREKRNETKNKRENQRKQVKHCQQRKSRKLKTESATEPIDEPNMCLSCASTQTHSMLFHFVTKSTSFSRVVQEKQRILAISESLFTFGYLCLDACCNFEAHENQYKTNKPPTKKKKISIDSDVSSNELQIMRNEQRRRVAMNRWKKKKKNERWKYWMMGTLFSFLKRAQWRTRRKWNVRKNNGSINDGDGEQTV